MILLLLVSGFVSICMGQYDDAVSISVVSTNENTVFTASTQDVPIIYVWGI